MSLNKFIVKINSSLEKIVPGLKLFGIAEPIARKKGTVLEVFPGVINNDGEVTEVTFDDRHAAMIYHKAVALAVRLSQNKKGFGDDPSAFVNGHGMQMIVYLNRKKVNLTPDQFFLFLQANIPYQIQVDPYEQVLIQINSVILNSQAVFDQEYKGSENPLPPNHSLMQINYTIESTFRQKCFEKCPEDC